MIKRINSYSFALISGIFICNLAYAGPQEGHVAAGNAAINYAGAVTTIHQTSPSAVINWQGFNTAANESVIFNQPNASSTVLNRITSGQPTNFAGSLSANGKVYIVNPAGMVFAKGSQINVGGLVATTSDISDNDFMQNKGQFSAMHQILDTASIINNGTLSTAEAGVVALIAPNVINNGVIQAKLDKIVLASGKTFVLDFNQDGLINFDLNSVVHNGHVVNNGVINAEGGKVLMTANTVADVLDRTASSYTINEAGSISVGKNGVVILNAGNTGNINISGHIEAGAAELVAKNGSVTESTILPLSVNTDPHATMSVNAQPGIDADKLMTISANGTVLDADGNHIGTYSAVNTNSGDIRLKNSADLTIHGITQTGGNLNISNIGTIFQDDLPQAAMKISGSSSFTQTQGHWGDNYQIRLLSDNQFIGPVSFSTAYGVIMRNSSHNIILGNVSVNGLIIENTAGSITQAPNTALTVTGPISLQTGDAEITVANKDNQLTGQIELYNSHFGNKNVSLYNKADTELYAAEVGGVLTVESPSVLTAYDNIIRSYATNAQNGHSIILKSPSVEVIPFNLQAGENNGYVIFATNPNFVFFDRSFNAWLLVHLFGISPPAAPSTLWNTSYSADSLKNIPAGNYVVYSDKSPVMAAAEIKSVGE